jgi:hypothetical protein
MGMKNWTAEVHCGVRAPFDEVRRISPFTFLIGTYNTRSQGVLYQDANVTVTAFPTKLEFTETYGYRFDTADRSIVISGDTNPTQAIVDACHGCDALIQEYCFLCMVARFCNPCSCAYCTLEGPMIANSLLAALAYLVDEPKFLLP